ncbi:hypothetical protein GCM10009835_47570 [Planosporangium flavigriseum]|uniref:Uncharacterized protein n=1 Tax=Planosporangium flavigriseum TaxID=373681 RepID=A0A8J3LHB1_9ACTN|nr:hypothetical protein Pfl04_01110 [Planosporangium flavigriseum]
MVHVSRVCRELVLSLSSARQAGEQAKSMLESGPEQNDALDQQTRVTRRATDLDLTVTWPNKFSPQIETEVQLTATQQTANLLHAGLVTKEPPVSVYKGYSAVAHGELYGLMHFMTPVQQPDGTELLHWGVDLDVLDSAVQVVILAFRSAWHRINAVMGWDNAEREQQWADDLDGISNFRMS